MSGTKTVAPPEDAILTTDITTGAPSPSHLHTEEKAQSISSIDEKEGKKDKKDKKSKKGSKQKDSDDAGDKGAKKEELTPVSFFALYRFHTKFEIILNFIGLFCAICSGAAQVRDAHPPTPLPIPFSLITLCSS
jgi:hypothetical protein